MEVRSLQPVSLSFLRYFLSAIADIFRSVGKNMSWFPDFILPFDEGDGYPSTVRTSELSEIALGATS